MIDLERARDRFKNHVATFQDLGKIKILDFKEPGRNDYRIRFLFENDYYRLHISGDLGELTAVNFKNMVWEDFYDDFGHNPGYFECKVKSHQRQIYEYDREAALEDLKEILKEEDIEYDEDDFDSFEDYIESEFLYDYDEEQGIGPKGYDALTHQVRDAWEFAYNIGKRKTGILDLYLLAFCLAYEQLGFNKKGE